MLRHRRDDGPEPFPESYFRREEDRVWSFQPLLGGSWVVISGVISRVTILITHIWGLITLLTTTHEPPSKG